MIHVTHSSASSCNSVVSTEMQQWTGTLERELAEYSSLSGTCMMSILNLLRCRCRRNLSIRGDNWSRSLIPSSGTWALCLVSSTVCFPKTKSDHFSHAEVAARASFLIWAYCHSVSLTEWDACATYFQWLSIFCSGIAPKPYAEASAEIFAEVAGL